MEDSARIVPLRPLSTLEKLKVEIESVSTLGWIGWALAVNAVVNIPDIIAGVIAGWNAFHH